MYQITITLAVKLCLFKICK